ncbi:hypothetical protein APHAL10511_003240 [Amanita phalloides]|nr:hypothetical protein APHAL10511_003240 [Amanita phalloides]
MSLPETSTSSSNIADIDTNMASPQPQPENGGNPAQWFATIMDQLVRNDTNLHQVLTQLGQTAAQATIQAQTAQAAVIAQASSGTGTAGSSSKPSIAVPDVFDGKF